MYNKTIWKERDIITHDKLNKIEVGVEANSTNLEVVDGKCMQLERSKANQSDVDKQGVRIDNIVAANNPTEGNSELADIRVGVDGTTYDSAGRAVREQFTKNNIAIEELMVAKGGFESQFEQIVLENGEQDTRLNKVEDKNKVQDVYIQALVNEGGDGRITTEVEGNVHKLEGSAKGIAEVELVEGNTLLNLAPKGVSNCDDMSAFTHNYLNVNMIQHSEGIEFICGHPDFHIAGYDNRDNGLIKGKAKYLICADVEVINSVADADMQISLGNSGSSEIKKLAKGRGIVASKISSTEDVLTANTGWVSIRNFNTPNIGDSFKIYSVAVFELTDSDFTKSLDELLLKHKTEIEGLQSSFEDNIVTQEMVDSGLESVENVGKYKFDVELVGENLFDKSNIVKDKYVLVNGNLGVDVGWFATDFMKVRKGQTIYISNNGGIRKPFSTMYSQCYDFDKKPLGVVFDHEKYGVISFVSKHDGYIRFSGIISELTGLDYISESNNYEPYHVSKQTLYLNSPLLKGDRIESRKDGVYHVHNSTSMLLDDSYTIGSPFINTNTTRFAVDVNHFKLKPNGIIPSLADKLLYNQGSEDIEHFRRDGSSPYGNILLWLTNNKATTVEQCKLYLKDNPIKMVHPLAEPWEEKISDNKLGLECANSSTVQFETIVPIMKSKISYTSSVPSVVKITKDIVGIEEHNIDMVANTFNMDYRLLEVEWALQDAGIVGVSLSNIIVNKNIQAKSLSRYEQAKIMIIGGVYDEAVLTKQLAKYLQKNLITQEEYDELILLMEERRVV